MKHRNAFTLIEILVVISLIAIFTTLLITQVTRTRSVGDDTNRAGLVRSITGVLESYKAQYGFYPISLSDSNIAKFQSYTPDQLALVRYIGFDIDGVFSTCEAYSVSTEMNSSNARELQHDDDRIIKYIENSADECVSPDFAQLENCTGTTLCMYGKPAETVLHNTSADWIFDLSNLPQ